MQIQTIEKCERLARAICMDLKLHHQKDIMHVKRGLPISKALVAAIDEARELYVSRTAPTYHSRFNDVFDALIGIGQRGDWSDVNPRTVSEAQPQREPVYVEEAVERRVARANDAEREGASKTFLVLVAVLIAFIAVILGFVVFDTFAN